MSRLQLTLDPPDVDEEAIRLHTRRMTRRQYLALCQANPDFHIERLASGEVVIIAPAHSRSGRRNIRIATRLDVWAIRDGSGLAFDSSTGFDLPNGATRSPDAAWVLRSRITSLAPEEQEEFLPLSPDFVVELRSRSDRLSDLQEKLREYIDNGTRLGWLIDPKDRKAYIYRCGHAVVILDDPAKLSGDPELPGFELDLTDVWTPW